jgi:hypothetical protein
MRKLQLLLLSLALTVLGVASLQAGALYTISNGTEYVDVIVDPYFLDPGDDIVDFYSYGSPDNASANTGFEQPETALVFLTLDDAGNYGLVAIMDVANDATGGLTQMYASGMAPGTITAVSDDPGECGAVQGDGTAVCEWYWSPCCTDGVAYEMGTNLNFAITLDFDFTSGNNNGIEILRFITFDPCNQGELLFFDLDYTESLIITSTEIPGDMIDCNDNNQPDHCDIENGTSLDCNLNEIPDECDIADGTSLDCNENGIPDECELFENDCNENGIPDDCEVDCNENGIPDDCDIAEGTSLDCNLNGVPDDCELVDNDCNENGIPDDCELEDNDCNENGIPDECELFENDCNENGVPDDCDIANGTSQDTNQNGIPDECENWTELDIPVEFNLTQNYPNPFNPTTTIAFAVAEPGQLSISVYDLTGKIVANLIDGTVPAGYHEVEFNAAHLPSGIYFYTMTSVVGVESRKMVLVK